MYTEKLEYLHCKEIYGLLRLLVNECAREWIWKVKYILFIDLWRVQAASLWLPAFILHGYLLNLVKILGVKTT